MSVRGSQALVDLRPLGLGELVDRSAAVWRAHWKPLFRLYLGFQLAQYVLLRIFELLTKSYFPFLRGGRVTQEALRGDPDQLLQQMAIAAPVVLLLTLALTLLTQALTVAGSAYVIPILQSRESSVGAAMRRLSARLGTTLGLVALSMGWLAGWGLVSLIPTLGLFGLAIGVESQALKAIAVVLGMLWMMLALLVILLAYVVRFATAAQVIAMEEVSGLGAYRRSRALSSGRVGEGALGLVKLRLALVITVVGIIVFVVLMLGSLPTLIIQGVYGKAFDPANADPDAVPQLLKVPADLLQIVISSLVNPLSAVALSLFYVDMRMRREGLDLELKLGQQP